MYAIDRTEYGYRLTLGGMIRREEMAQWVAASVQALTRRAGGFGVILDLREMKPLPPDAQEELKRGQLLYKSRGMERSAVILDDHLVSMQCRRIAREIGIHHGERYIVASTTPDWEVVGRDWVERAVDPDWKFAANRTSG